MTYKALTAIHEIRMCIVQIGIPVVIGAIYLYENPELRQVIKKGVRKAKNKVLHPFRKDPQKRPDGSYDGEII